jgi:hypothetical protein
MRLNGKFVGQLVEADLHQLVEDGRYEDQNLDFKVAAYGRGDNDKREFLKDVIGFANSTGGVILIGIEDVGDQAKNIPGIELENEHDPISRYERTIRDGTEPPLYGCQLAAISVGLDGRVVVAIGIPASFARPHRVKLGSGRWTIRRNRDTEDMTYSEIRGAFMDTASLESRVRTFHADRRRYAREYATENNLGENNGVMLIHVVPMATEGVRLDVPAAVKLRDSFPSPGQVGAAALKPDLDGVTARLNVAAHLGWGWAKVFRNGCAEGLVSGYVGSDNFQGDKRLAFYHERFVRDAHMAVCNYLEGLVKLGFNPPFYVVLSLLNALGSRIFSQNIFNSEVLSVVIATADPVLIDVVQNSRNPSYYIEIRPLFDQIWNAFGLPECSVYTKDGNWLGA